MTTARKVDYKNGAYKSRKFTLTLLGVILITLLAAAGIWYPTVPAVYPTFIGGILGVLSLYFTGNVMNKYVVGKTAIQLKQDNEENGDT